MNACMSYQDGFIFFIAQFVLIVVGVALILVGLDKKT
jgi:hypothetical protein